MPCPGLQGNKMDIDLPQMGMVKEFIIYLIEFVFNLVSLEFMSYKV